MLDKNVKPLEGYRYIEEFMFLFYYFPVWKNTPVSEGISKNNQKLKLAQDFSIEDYNKLRERFQKFLLETKQQKDKLNFSYADNHNMFKLVGTILEGSYQYDSSKLLKVSKEEDPIISIDTIFYTESSYFDYNFRNSVYQNLGRSHDLELRNRAKETIKSCIFSAKENKNDVLVLDVEILRDASMSIEDVDWLIKDGDLKVIFITKNHECRNRRTNCFFSNLDKDVIAAHLAKSGYKVSLGVKVRPVVLLGVCGPGQGSQFTDSFITQEYIDSFKGRKKTLKKVRKDLYNKAKDEIDSLSTSNLSCVTTTTVEIIDSKNARNFAILSEFLVKESD